MFYKYLSWHIMVNQYYLHVPTIQYDKFNGDIIIFTIVSTLLYIYILILQNKSYSSMIFILLLSNSHFIYNYDLIAHDIHLTITTYI